MKSLCKRQIKRLSVLNRYILPVYSPLSVDRCHNLTGILNLVRIRNAFVLSFLICSLISILIALGLSHWNLKQQIKHYVHEKTAQDFEPVIEQLLSRYDPIEGWQYYESRSRRLIDDVVLTLESPEQYGIMPPPPRRGRPDGPRGDRGNRGDSERNQRRTEQTAERSSQRAINTDSRNSDSRRRPSQPDIALLDPDNTVISGKTLLDLSLIHI